MRTTFGASKNGKNGNLLAVCISIVETEVGVVLGFALSETKNGLARRRRATVHWRALKAEVEICSKLANRFFEDNIVESPNRLPMEALGNASHRFSQTREEYQLGNACVADVLFTGRRIL